MRYFTFEIVIEKEPSDDGYLAYSPTLPGFNRFQIGDLSIDLPQIQSRTLVTKMILENGQTAVIGGLVSEDSFEQERKVPFLGDIPLVGYLFKWKRNRKTKESLLVFITPYLIRSPSETQKMIDEEVSRRRDALKAERLRIFGAAANTGEKPPEEAETESTTTTEKE